MTSQADLFRELPGVDELLRTPQIAPLVALEGQAAVADACREVLGHLRAEIAAHHLDRDNLELALSGIHAAIEKQLARALRYSLRPVINATGVILHTNLGRAPLGGEALKQISSTAANYSNLEFDLSSGERGRRDVHVDRLLRKILGPDRLPPVRVAATGLGSATDPPTPAGQGKKDEAGEEALRREDISTILVNNNAAAVLLALNTLAEGGEVIVSRGELVEIGGSFRIPDVMAKSGAVLREVGTTNRTRTADYERAIHERTRLLLRVHRSNFAISGFTEQPTLAAMVALAQKYKLPLMEDLGSGALVDLRQMGIKDEPTVMDSLEAGVHVVTYSGDKLLGGPQAGLISGREDLVRKMRANSLFRALRVDKLTYAALEATLLAYAKRDYDNVPVIRMMRLSVATIARRAEELAATVDSQHLHCELVDGESLLGGGSAPSAVLPTKLLAISPSGSSANQLLARLRAFDPPIIARLEEDRVLLDLRTVVPDQDSILASALRQL